MSQLYSECEPACSSGPRRTCLAALRALLRTHRGAALVDGSGQPAAFLSGEWSDAGATTLPCFVRDGDGGVAEVRFVIMGRDAVMLARPAASGAPDGSDDDEIFTMQLPRGSDELIEACMAQLSFGRRRRGGGPPTATPDARDPHNQQPQLPRGGFGGDAPQQPPPPLVGRGRFGDSDLMPAGTVPVGRGGGMLVGPNSALFAGRGGGGNDGFGSGAGVGGGVPDFGAQFGRYSPMFPGDNRGGRGGRGGGGPANVFPGEPDPDHLRPFSNNQLPPRGGGLGPGGRFNYGF